MRDPVRLDWRVPTDEYERFVSWVESEFPEKNGYLGREMEMAMREHIAADDYDAVEDRIDELLQAAGRTAGDLDKKINSHNYATETVRCTARIESSIKDDFAAFADANDRPYGRELARALEKRRTGGRANRVEEKLDRVLADAEALLSEASEDSESSSMGVVKRKTIAIANELPERFTEDELEVTIQDAGDVTSEPTIEKYKERVAEHRNVVRHPRNPKLYIPEAEYESLRPADVPDEVFKHVTNLTGEETADRIRLAAGAAAIAKENGKRRITADDIYEEAFDREISKSAFRDHLREATVKSGFELDTSRQESALLVDLNDVTQFHPDLMQRIREYYEADHDCLFEISSNATLGKYMPARATEGNPRTAMTDGGED